MSLLDDARRLAEQDVVADCDTGYMCVFCEGDAHIPLGGPWEVKHTPDCPWLSLPKIIAALEAAERVAYYDDAHRSQECHAFLYGSDHCNCGLSSLREALDA